MKTFEQWATARRWNGECPSMGDYINYALAEMLKTMREERRARDNLTEKTFRELKARVSDVETDLDIDDTNFVALSKRVDRLETAAKPGTVAGVDLAKDRDSISYYTSCPGVWMTAKAEAYAAQSVHTAKLLIDAKDRIAAGMSQAGRDASRNARQWAAYDMIYPRPSWYNTPRRSWFSLDDGDTIKHQIAQGMAKAWQQALQEAWFTPSDAQRAKDVWEKHLSAKAAKAYDGLRYKIYQIGRVYRVYDAIREPARPGHNTARIDGTRRIVVAKFFKELDAHDYAAKLNREAQ